MRCLSLCLLLVWLCSCVNVSHPEYLLYASGSILDLCDLPEEVLPLDFYGYFFSLLNFFSKWISILICVSNISSQFITLLFCLTTQNLVFYIQVYGICMWVCTGAHGHICSEVRGGFRCSSLLSCFFFLWDRIYHWTPSTVSHQQAIALPVSALLLTFL